MTKTTFKNDEILNTSYFYGLFEKRKHVFPTSYFLFPTHTRKKTLPVNSILFKKIIKTYLNIYFNEFYSNRQSKYFFLSGTLEKSKGSSMLARTKGVIEDVKSIAWMWYNRPSFCYVSNMKIIKLKGSTSKLNALEREFHNNYDVSTMKHYKTLCQELITNNKLFKDA